MAASRGQIGFIYLRLDEDELCNSPASIRNGLPSTISCVAAPRFSRWGAPFSWARIEAVSRPENRSSIEIKQIRNGITWPTFRNIGINRIESWQTILVHLLA